MQHNQQDLLKKEITSLSALYSYKPFKTPFNETTSIWKLEQCMKYEATIAPIS